jgi:hypothetical protein
MNTIKSSQNKVLSIREFGVRGKISDEHNVFRLVSLSNIDQHVNVERQPNH